MAHSRGEFEGQQSIDFDKAVHESVLVFEQTRKEVCFCPMREQCGVVVEENRSSRNDFRYDIVTICQNFVDTFRTSPSCSLEFLESKYCA